MSIEIYVTGYINALAGILHCLHAAGAPRCCLGVTSRLASCTDCSRSSTLLFRGHVTAGILHCLQQELRAAV